MKSLQQRQADITQSDDPDNRRAVFDLVGQGDGMVVGHAVIVTPGAGRGQGRRFIFGA